MILLKLPNKTSMNTEKKKNNIFYRHFNISSFLKPLDILMPYYVFISDEKKLLLDFCL